MMTNLTVTHTKPNIVDQIDERQGAQPMHVVHKSNNIDEDAKRITDIVSNYTYDDEVLLAAGKTELSNKCQCDTLSLPKYKSIDEKGIPQTKTSEGHGGSQSSGLRSNSDGR